MDLFSSLLPEPINILPQDGCAEYHGILLDDQQADYYFDVLLNDIAWQCDQAVIFGKRLETKRKVAWYGQSDTGNSFNYTYSNTTKVSLPWTQPLLALKALIEQQTQETYNACLLNLYHSGDEGMAWHSDGETDLKKNGAIASFSLGAERKFCFKHKQSKELICVDLQAGSLLVMKDNTQQNWLHRLPPTKKVKTARVNLTFRTIVK